MADRAERRPGTGRCVSPRRGRWPRFGACVRFGAAAATSAGPASSARRRSVVRRARVGFALRLRRRVGRGRPVRPWSGARSSAAWAPRRPTASGGRRGRRRRPTVRRAALGRGGSRAPRAQTPRRRRGHGYGGRVVGAVRRGAAVLRRVACGASTVPGSGRASPRGTGPGQLGTHELLELGRHLAPRIAAAGRPPAAAHVGRAAAVTVAVSVATPPPKRSSRPPRPPPCPPPTGPPRAGSGYREIRPPEP